MKQKVIGVRFDLPFALKLPETSFRFNLDKSHLCFVKVKVGLGRTEFASEEAIKGKQEWDAEKGTFMADETSWSTTDKKRRSLEVMLDKTTNQSLIYRRPQGYTSVDIFIIIPDTVDVNTYRKDLRGNIFKIISRFLLGYRLCSQDHTIPDLRREDISVVETRYGTYTEAGRSDQEYEFNLSGGFATFQAEPMERHIKSFLAQKTIDQLAQWLKDGLQISQHDRLLLIATEQAHVYGDYALSVISAQTAFEVFLSNFIKDRAAMAGITQLTMKKGEHKPINEALEDSFLLYKIKGFIPEITKCGIAGTKEYNDWHTYAYVLRNAIVHAGKRDVSFKDAKKAFECITTLIKKITEIN